MSKNLLNIYYRETFNKVNSYEEYFSSLIDTLDTQQWKKVLSADTQYAYESYIYKYSNGIYKNEAQKKIDNFIEAEIKEADKKAWEKAKKKNSKKSYEKYLMSYYNGIYSNEAKRKLDEFIRLEKERELEKQRQKEIEEAKERARREKIEKEKRLALEKEKEAWEIVCKKNTKEDYENYLKFYPNGIYRYDAIEKIDNFIALEQQRLKEIENEKNKKLKEEEELWEKARKENFSNTYLEYCESYPNGFYIDEAYNRYEEEKLIEKDISFLVEWIDRNCFNPKPKDIRELKQILKLNIHISNSWGEKKELKTLPTEIGKLLSLEELIISSDIIDKIPTSIGNLKNLKKLTIDCDLGIILSLPETIGDLLNLEELILKLNKYTKIPTSIGKLKKLKKLDITVVDYYDKDNITLEVSGLNLLKNKFLNKQENILDSSFYKELTARIYEVSVKRNDMLEAIGTLQNIEELKLDHQNLVEIPYWIKNFTKLKKLSISYRNNVKELPKWIGDFLYLEELNINTYYSSMTQSDKNRKTKKITKLPNSICELKTLKRLIITAGALEELPENIGDLTELEELNIQGNFESYSFTELPKSIIKLKKLKILNISWKNNLKEIPKDLFTLENLEEFYAVTCNINEFPDNISNNVNLKKIALSGNQISSIPSSIENMKNLEELHLNGNPLENFPKSIIYLNNLKILVLDNCNISEVPSFIENCQSLESLSVSHNTLSELPESIGKIKTLKTLACGYNQLVELPKSIYDLEKLDYIWIMHNKLDKKCKLALNEWENRGNGRRVEM